jgi:hypothetical protein
MNLRNTYLLFAAVVVVLVVCILVLEFGPRGDGDDYLFPEFHDKSKTEKTEETAKTIDKVEIERLQPAADTILFERSGTTWVMKKPYPAKIDSALIDRLVDSLISARLDKKSPVPPKSQDGLDTPSAAITLMRGNKSYRIILGNSGLGSDGRVFAVTGEHPNRPIAFRRNVLSEILQSEAVGGSVGASLKSITEFRPQNLLADGSPIPWDAVQRIDIKDPGHEIELKKEAAGGWLFLKPQNFGSADLEGDPEGPAMENIAGVKPLLTRLVGLRMPKKEDVIEGESNFDQYGLAAGKESLRIELDDPNPDVLLIGKKVDPKGDQVFARIEGERFVVKIDAKPFEPIHRLLESPKAMRDRNLTNITQVSVDAIDIKIGGEKPVELWKVGEPAQWRIFEGGDAYENANNSAVQQLLSALTMPRNIKDFPDTSAGDKALGLDPPAVTIDIWSDGIIKDVKKDEKKADEQKKTDDKKSTESKAADEKKESDNKKEAPKPAVIKRPTLKGEPTIRLAFGKKDKDIVYVRRTTGIVSMVVALPQATLEMATQPLTHYMDLILPSFERSQAIKIAFNRGDGQYVIEKIGGDTSPGGWKITQPTDLSERNLSSDRIEQIVTGIVTLSANSVIARKATADELTRFGLRPPKLELTVTLKDVKEPRVYQFGNETDDKQQVYFKFGDSDRVYLVSKALPDQIKTGELIDLTIWRLDPSKMKEIKITGWKSLTGGMPLTLDLIRKSEKEWSVKDQADYVVDAGKADALAGSLANLRAIRFLKYKGGPAPDNKLDLQADAITIDITVDGEKDPYTLTLGAEVKEGMAEFFAASSNKAPGAVFLVLKAPFAEIRKGGRGYLQKAK